MDEKECISGFSIFAGASPEHLEEIAKHVALLHFDSGETIFQEGAKASRVYGLLDGEVELILVAKDSVLKTDVQYEEYARSKTETVERDIIVDSIGPGEIFGWSAFSPEGRYTSKAVCVEPSRVFALPADNLRVLFNKYPQVGYPFMERLLEIIAKRLTNRTDRLIEVWSEAFNGNRI
jgi:CRP-like cAMP-binding protein